MKNADDISFECRRCVPTGLRREISYGNGSMGALRSSPAGRRGLAAPPHFSSRSTAARVVVTHVSEADRSSTVETIRGGRVGGWKCGVDAPQAVDVTDTPCRQSVYSKNALHERYEALTLRM